MVGDLRAVGGLVMVAPLGFDLMSVEEEEEVVDHLARNLEHAEEAVVGHLATHLDEGLGELVAVVALKALVL
ncbi:hypothetical protein N431DRAFT_431137 [Stipitochalara longipes BDJ]|nr:hypothetical protein N431DRAFT_431137 [Stipitochalara longipes BDJ]